MGRAVRYSVVVASLAALIAIVYRLGNAPIVNNVCPTINDYINMDTNPKCWYDPDVEANVTEIIKNNGYVSETHEVTSADGQILTVFRIINLKNSGKKSKGPVYLQHGLTGSSVNYVGLGKDSLAFVLTEAGYDVWLGNARGTIYSMKHKKYSNRDYKFWDHSFHEMGYYDLPAVFKYIRNKCNNEKVIYVGFSMGTAQAIVYGSVYPKESVENVKIMILLSPVVINKNVKGFSYVYLAPVWKKFNDIFPEGFYDLYLDYTSGKSNILYTRYLPTYWQIKMHAYLLDLIGLVDVNEMNAKDIPKVLNHNPQGASLKSHVHLFSYPREFRMYNNGKEMNLKKYGTENPPKYNITDIQVPIYMYYSHEDDISRHEDVLDLYDMLPAKAKHGIRRIVTKKFTHLDYMYGARAKTLVYDHMLTEVLSKLDNKK